MPINPVFLMTSRKFLFVLYTYSMLMMRTMDQKLVVNLTAEMQHFLIKLKFKKKEKKKLIKQTKQSYIWSIKYISS